MRSATQGLSGHRLSVSSQYAQPTCLIRFPICRVQRSIIFMDGPLQHRVNMLLGKMISWTLSVSYKGTLAPILYVV